LALLLGLAIIANNCIRVSRIFSLIIKYSYKSGFEVMKLVIWDKKS